MIKLSQLFPLFLFVSGVYLNENDSQNGSSCLTFEPGFKVDPDVILGEWYVTHKSDLGGEICEKRVYKKIEKGVEVSILRSTCKQCPLEKVQETKEMTIDSDGIFEYTVPIIGSEQAEVFKEYILAEDKDIVLMAECDQEGESIKRKAFVMSREAVVDVERYEIFVGILKTFDIDHEKMSALSACE